MTIGQRIKQRRKELKMSADELGDRLGVNRSTVFRYENGFIEKLPIDFLDPIAKALQTTPQHLMGWEDTQRQPAKSELSTRKQEFMRKVEEMSDAQIEKLEQILALVEAKEQ